MACVFVSGRGLVGRLVRDFHSGETDQEDLLQTQTLSREVDQHFIRPAHPACSLGQVIPWFILDWLNHVFGHSNLLKQSITHHFSAAFFSMGFMFLMSTNMLMHSWNLCVCVSV